ncbi:MAG: integrase [Gammaproteobacteria bacterium]|nr:MAG: integrase [Gammaproteobacteria bacterium]
MLEQVVSTRVARSLRGSGGNVFGEGFDALSIHLGSRGYAARCIYDYLWIVAKFGAWLKRKKIILKTISEGTTKDFLKGFVSSPSRRARAAGLRHLLVVLRERGLVRPRRAQPVTPAHKITAAYGAYLHENRGLQSATIVWHIAYVRDFLTHAKVENAADLRRISGDHIRGFIAQIAQRYTPGSVKNVTKALRGFLRFLQVTKGFRTAGLLAAVPSIREWKLAGVPKYLTDDQLHRVLASFDVSTSSGLRDRAIAVCIADLGLRSIEVAHLSLDSIDWSAGTIRVDAGKSARDSELPLPTSVGRALVAYLRHGRPVTATRRVFVQDRAPVGEPLLPGSIGATMKRAFKRAGVTVSPGGAHALRHTAATRMLRAGANIKEIADILRHRSIDTTAIYAKVDLVRLQEVALPWPMAGQ